MAHYTKAIYSLEFPYVAQGYFRTTADAVVSYLSPLEMETPYPAYTSSSSLHITVQSDFRKAFVYYAERLGSRGWIKFTEIQQRTYPPFLFTKST